MKAIELVPMGCNRCGAGVMAAPGEVLWACTVCGEGAYLDENDELRPIEISFVNALRTQGNLLWLPYWSMTGRITITKRVTFGPNQGPSKLWTLPRLFWIAAFETPVGSAIRDCRDLFENQPVLERGPRADFMPVTIDIPSARILGEFFVLSVEARAHDALAEIQLDAQFDAPALWVLPFQDSGGGRLKAQFKRDRPPPLDFLHALAAEVQDFLRLFG